MIRIQKFMVGQKIVKATAADIYYRKEVLIARAIISASKNAAK